MDKCVHKLPHLLIVASLHRIAQISGYFAVLILKLSSTELITSSFTYHFFLGVRDRTLSWFSSRLPGTSLSVSFVASSSSQVSSLSAGPPRAQRPLPTRCVSPQNPASRSFIHSVFTEYLLHPRHSSGPMECRAALTISRQEMTVA